MLLYLAETFPSSLLPLGQSRWQVVQWVFWQAANLGPTFGNKLSYTRYMDSVPREQKAHPLERFNTEAQRLLGVLNKQLDADKPYLCGDEFTIADIACYPWVRGWKWSKIDIAAHETGRRISGALKLKRNIAAPGVISLQQRVLPLLQTWKSR